MAGLNDRSCRVPGSAGRQGSFRGRWPHRVKRSAEAPAGGFAGPTQFSVMSGGTPGVGGSVLADVSSSGARPIRRSVGPAHLRDTRALAPPRPRASLCSLALALFLRRGMTGVYFSQGGFPSVPGRPGSAADRVRFRAAYAFAAPCGG
jgi:hypothetical protein